MSLLVTPLVSFGFSTLESVLFTLTLAIPTIVILYLLSTFISGAGYEPVPGKILDKMIQFSKPSEGKQVFDLGSGFGRIVIKVAQRTGATCTGVEVDPLKVWWSRLQVRRKHLDGRVRILRSNLLNADISDADIIFVFLWDGIMSKLRTKALREMKQGALVVSYYHRFHDWVPEEQDERSRVFVYRIEGQLRPGEERVVRNKGETPGRGGP